MQPGVSVREENLHELESAKVNHSSDRIIYVVISVTDRHMEAYGNQDNNLELSVSLPTSIIHQLWRNLQQSQAHHDHYLLVKPDITSTQDQV
jgi:hypothetical protein